MDGIYGSHLIKNYSKFGEKFYELSGKQFGTLFGDVTGEELFEFEDHAIQISSDKMKWRCWTIKRVKNKTKLEGDYEYYLEIKGCPAHSLFDGKNIQTISLADFKSEVELLADFLGVNPSEIKIKPSEVSITIYPDFDFLIKGRFVNHQNKIFEGFYKDKSDKFMGVIAKNSHYEVWVYYVNVKYPELENVAVRIERKYNRVATYKRETGIESFADIINLKGAEENYKLINQTVDDLIIFDPTLKPNRKLYSKLINDCIKKGGDSSFWFEQQKILSSRAFWKLVNEYRKLSSEKGEGLFTKIKDNLKRNKFDISREKMQNVTCGLGVTLCNKDKEQMLKININAIEYKLTNMNTNKVVKSKKQLAKQKREQKKLLYSTFFEILKVTLKEIELKQVPVKYKMAA